MYMKTFKKIGIKSYFVFTNDPCVRIYQMLDKDGKTARCRELNTNIRYGYESFSIKQYKNAKFETYSTLNDVKLVYPEMFI